MNKIILIGNLTRDPELTETGSGVPVCQFTVAVNRGRASQDGSRDADFYRVSAWRGQAETCAKYLRKGRKVCVIGNLQPREYDDRDGNHRISLDVAASDVEFLSSASGGDGQDGEAAERPTRPQKKERPKLEQIVDDDDLPF